MNSKERHEARFRRRKEKRERNRRKRCEELGTVEEILSFGNLHKAGRKCCNGVRWKASTQNFEADLIRRAADARAQLLSGEWRPMPYSHFSICERGKERDIDAPHINDRMVHKVITQRVLYPLYTPSMIADNGASIKGKGLRFAQKRLKEQLRWFYRRYGTEGYVIHIDIHDYFGSASREYIKKRHKKYILDDRLREIADGVVDSFPGERGMLLGVEMSQIEMVAYPSVIDSWMKCQRGLKCASHYMDDYIIIAHCAKKEAWEIFYEAAKRFEEIGLEINRRKSRIQPLSKPFRFCKAKFALTATGRVMTHGCRDCIGRDRRKIRRIAGTERAAAWFMIARSYYEGHDDHGRVLRLNRIFYTAGRETA